MAAKSVDAIVVGAGFTGLYMLHKLRGLGLSAQVVEAGTDVGGTWYWNRYPGARCDIESFDYSYSFDEGLQQDWVWSERYATQPEILSYLQHVAERFDLRRDIAFETRVTAAHWDEAQQRWHVETDRGDSFDARFCIMGTGCLSSFNRPNIAGLDSFAGPTYMTGHWPHEGVDFTGKRVAVIGTGSSAIQSIPQIARQASHLTVFQRTPNFAVPAQNHPLTEADHRKVKANYAELREAARQSLVGAALMVPQSTQPALAASPEELTADLDRRWEHGGLPGFVGTHPDVGTELEAAERLADYVRGKIRQRVKDPAVAEKLCPTNHPFGSKRLCVDINYFETYNRDNVTLVDINETPIEAVEPEGVRTSAGLVPVDALVLATGFDAMTGTLARIDIRGRGGVALKDEWAHGPHGFLGLMTAGFPNLFTVTGPGSPSVLSNMVTSIEQHVEWISDLLAAMRARGAKVVEALSASEDRWVEHANAVAEPTIYMHANSWYVGANVPGKPRVFTAYLGGVNTYRAICDALAAEGYPGLAFDGQGRECELDFESFLPVPEEAEAA